MKGYYRKISCISGERWRGTLISNQFLGMALTVSQLMEHTSVIFARKALGTTSTLQFITASTLERNLMCVESVAKASPSTAISRYTLSYTVERDLIPVLLVGRVSGEWHISKSTSCCILESDRTPVTCALRASCVSPILRTMVSHIPQTDLTSVIHVKRLLQPQPDYVDISIHIKLLSNIRV